MALLVEDILDLSHVVHPRLIHLLALPVMTDEEAPRPLVLPRGLRITERGVTDVAMVAHCILQAGGLLSILIVALWQRAALHSNHFVRPLHTLKLLTVSRKVHLCAVAGKD